MLTFNSFEHKNPTEGVLPTTVLVDIVSFTATGKAERSVLSKNLEEFSAEEISKLKEIESYLVALTEKYK